ncbi:DUF3022 domain-containing protein [Paraburkholderia sp. MMS20-SJTN17]|uniref:DUF3022 domain-containing protein n=1 Tax=Paraburkholderia translucens TaxID=2886945 RepID=A0ABS8KME9_9BURK|nr:DUF3022 domain-containing protein [Paraburkholderia sp. MMS20-SJTN17]MCC8405890.1 DUF3022 domain-containing protein [Paraburkholderia sp. MMS20-SJTN17]
MIRIDRHQRIEELQLATVDLFKSVKTPTANVYDEGSTVYMQISWVPESHADSTLDSRCVCTVRFTGKQIDRYAAMDTAGRLRVQRRLRVFVREHCDATRPDGSQRDDCSDELAPGDDLLDVPH